MITEISNVPEEIINDWLGLYPKHWQVKRIKDIFGDFGSGTTPLASNPKYYENGDIPWLNTSDLNNGIVFETKMKITREALDETTLKIYPQASLVIAMYGQGKTRGTVGLVDFPFTTNQASCVMLKPKGIDSRYVLFWFKSKYENIRAINVGASQPNMNQDFIKFLKIHYPPIKEQTAIANYLDIKTQAIDKKISLLKKKIGYYQELRKSLINETVTKGLNRNVKLKDSNINWIGKIPEHWEVKRFKDTVLKYTTGGTPSTSNTEYFNGNNLWVCISDINESMHIGDSKIKLTDEAIQNANLIKTPKGALLYSFKLSIGKMAFVESDIYTNEAILSIFPNKNINLSFYYFMLHPFMMLAATENIYGAKMLNQKLIANALIVHPPFAEQKEISDYLNSQTSQIDKITSNFQSQITILQELRKTLINDVVTGKIKVIND